MGLIRRLMGKKQEPTQKVGHDVSQSAGAIPISPAGQLGESDREALAFHLGKTVDCRQIPAIQEYLNDDSVKVRRAAVSSLEQQWPTGDALGIEALKRGLRDADAEVRETAALGIGEFVPCAKTPSATEMGSEAIKELLVLLLIEEDERVLGSVFTSLANVDDSALIPSFSEAVKRLELDKVYLGIRSISQLQATGTRGEMISALQSVEASLDVPLVRGQQQEYQGRAVEASNAEVLQALEESVGKPVPIVTHVDATTYGALIENKKVVELGLHELGLVSLPDSFGQLAGLRVLYMTKNKIGALPENFGNLTSLRRLLVQWNELTSLPDGIVKLKHLEFLRLDRKAATHVSDDVSTWLRQQEKRLGPTTFLWS